jgi:hypothetical protein
MLPKRIIPVHCENDTKQRAKQDTHKKQTVRYLTQKMEAICSSETSVFPNYKAFYIYIYISQNNNDSYIPPKYFQGGPCTDCFTTCLSCAGASYNSRYSKQFIESAKLLHWSGRFKPWSHRAAHAQVWDRYYIPDPTGQFRPARKRDPRGVST